MDLDRVGFLIKKNHIVGTETAREYPHGEWREISQIPELATLLLVKLSVGVKGRQSNLSNKDLTTTRVLPGATEALVGSEKFGSIPELLQDAAKVDDVKANPPVEVAPALVKEDHQGFDVNDVSGVELNVVSREKTISKEETIVFRPAILPEQMLKMGRHFEKFNKPRTKNIMRTIAVLLAILGVAAELFLPEKQGASFRVQIIKPRLPAFSKIKPDPEKSVKSYEDGIRYYVLDNVDGYRLAARMFDTAISMDADNIKALAMLASSYLNLIDSSNKDDNYFNVISKLIEMSRAKATDLSETVIADVEFFITVNKPEAAQNRIVEYTKTHNQFGLELFYYLALTYYQRGDFQSAAKYVSQIPDNKVFSCKVFYLRGLILKKLSDDDGALREFEKAIQMRPDHVKSRLQIAELMYKRNNLQQAAGHLDYIVGNVQLVPPQGLAQAYYYHAILNEMHKKWDEALGDVERAVKLAPENHDYLLEFYQLRAKAGDAIEKLRPEARMYFFMGEGEKLLKEGKYQEALIQFLEARRANDASPAPLVKMGDMFLMLRDIGNARLNYHMATRRAPKDIKIWSKYINVLIQSYEWNEAQNAMDTFRKLSVPQSAIDKAAADMYQKQGRYAEAQRFYRKAMSRETIDPTVYISYAKSLMSTKNFKEAPFFYALALRFDPLNFEALIGTAKCIAETESIDRAITMLQDELQKSAVARAELLAAIAELYIQKGDWEQAERNVEQAMAANQNYAYPWKLQAQIYINKESEKGYLDKVLAAYKSYSDRNSSDPSGYLERYKIFVKKAEFENASNELSKIYGIYPKYPNLHYYKGAMYSVMGNHKTAIEEFLSELANNPNSMVTILALGREYIDVGHFDEALKQFNKAMRIAPASAEAKQQAGYANYLLKNYHGAIALYNAALMYDKANPLIHKRLGMAYRDMGDRASAAQAFKRYLEMEPDAPDRAEFEMYQQ
ncbi:MAG: tetratricopeptide repeat protein [Candidatus Poribacteria bacterium]